MERMLSAALTAGTFGKFQGKGKTMHPYQKFSTSIFEIAAHTPPKAAKAPKVVKYKGKTLDGLGGLAAPHADCKIIWLEQHRSKK